MKAVFADTFFFLAVLNPGDQAHARATELGRALERPHLTTDWVLTEVGDAMAVGGNRGAFVEFLEWLKQSQLVTIVPASRALFERGVDLFAHRPDKEWTLTDCISFVVMEENGLREALTGDKHFEQAGFTPLLK